MYGASCQRSSLPPLQVVYGRGGSEFIYFIEFLFCIYWIFDWEPRLLDPCMMKSSTF